MFAGLRDSCYSSVTNSLLGGNWRDSEILRCFFWPRENALAFSSMFGERSFLNLFRDNRTPLDLVASDCLNTSPSFHVIRVQFCCLWNINSCLLTPNWVVMVGSKARNQLESSILITWYKWTNQKAGFFTFHSDDVTRTARYW